MCALVIEVLNKKPARQAPEHLHCKYSSVQLANSLGGKGTRPDT